MMLVAGLCFCVLEGSLLLSLLTRFAPAKLTSDRETLSVIVGSVSLHGGALLLVVFFLRWSRMTWREAFGFDTAGRGRALLLGVGAAVAVFPLAMLLSRVSLLSLTWINENYPSLHLKPVAQTTVLALQATESLGMKVVFGIIALVLAPVAEELVFRGIFYPTLKQNGFPRAAWWGTALMFAAMHANVMTFIPLALLAFVLTWLYEHTGNLAASMIAHSSFNTLNFALLLLFPDSAT